ncbi:uncharacterized protein EI90DRAFT_3044538 [Cantharellus anzutake]|uniref:uncharacterized protein n=1 Tax=Cantharellus anzutake TaxID=1750568 RepID=UPI0019040A39|nr:uncharacterized protein EI90DRAFT_3044538 [Cantharellus anzutake]KAF8337012.1 hypothetical protein EI90DRAFT_3044538 [Cantharellus anzutake]
MNAIFPLPGKLRNLKKLKVFGVDHCWDGHLFEEDDPEVRLDTLEIRTPINELSALSEFRKSMAYSIRTCTLDGMVDSLYACTGFFNNTINIKHSGLGDRFLLTCHHQYVALTPVTLLALTSVELGSSSHRFFFECLSCPSLRHLSLQTDRHPHDLTPRPPHCTFLSAIPALTMIFICMNVVMLECQTTCEALNKLLDFIGGVLILPGRGRQGAFERLSYFRISYDGRPLDDAQTMVAANWIERILTHKPHLRVDYYDTNINEPFSEMPFAGLETSFRGFGVESVEKLYDESLAAEKAGVGEQR